VDGGHWPELTQVGEDGRLAEVAGVDDQVGGAEKVETRLRQKTGTARQMGIGDQCEPDQLWSRSERARFSNMRLRYADLSARRWCWCASSGVTEVSTASCSSVARSC
jgi:hypothetical protein